MTTGAVLFMALSWAFVLGLMGWSFWRILRPKPAGLDAGPDNGRGGDDGGA